jgi:hypothetical protein
MGTIVQGTVVVVLVQAVPPPNLPILPQVLDILGKSPSVDIVEGGMPTQWEEDMNLAAF